MGKSENRAVLALTFLVFHASPLVRQALATDQLVYDCTFSIERPKEPKSVVTRRFHDNEPLQVTLREYIFIVQTVKASGGDHLQLRVRDACGDGSETEVIVGYAHPTITLRMGTTMAQGECWYKPDGHFID